MNILKEKGHDFYFAVWNNYAAEVVNYDFWLLKWSSLVLKIRSIVTMPLWFLSCWWVHFLRNCKNPPTPLTKEYLQLPIASVDYTEEQLNKWLTNVRRKLKQYVSFFSSHVFLNQTKIVATMETFRLFLRRFVLWFAA